MLTRPHTAGHCSSLVLSPCPLHHGPQATLRLPWGTDEGDLPALAHTSGEEDAGRAADEGPRLGAWGPLWSSGCLEVFWPGADAPSPRDSGGLPVSMMSSPAPSVALQDLVERDSNGDMPNLSFYRNEIRFLPNGTRPLTAGSSPCRGVPSAICWDLVWEGCMLGPWLSGSPTVPPGGC